MGLDFKAITKGSLKKLMECHTGFLTLQFWRECYHDGGQVAPVGFLNHQTGGLDENQDRNKKLDCLVWDVLCVSLCQTGSIQRWFSKALRFKLNILGQDVRMYLNRWHKAFTPYLSRATSDWYSEPTSLTFASLVHYDSPRYVRVFLKEYHTC